MLKLVSAETWQHLKGTCGLVDLNHELCLQSIQDSVCQKCLMERVEERTLNELVSPVDDSTDVQPTYWVSEDHLKLALQERDSCPSRTRLNHDIVCRCERLFQRPGAERQSAHLDPHLDPGQGASRRLVTEAAWQWVKARFFTCYELMEGAPACAVPSKPAADELEPAGLHT